MSSLLNELEEDLRTDKIYYKNKRRYYRDHKDDIVAVLRELKLPENTAISVRSSSEYIQLNVSGGPAEIKELFRTFRKLGYEPTSRPKEKPEATFSCYFNREGCPDFYLYFTSTVCHRIKVGTETIERDIYEVVCE